MELQFFANIQRLSDKVRSQNRDFRIDTNVFLNIIRAIVSGGQQDILSTICFPLAQFYPNRINKGLFAHRLHDPGRTQNGNTTDNSESWIECLFRKLFSIWNGDHNGETTVIVGQAAYFFEIFTNHLPGDRVDCGSTYRLIQAALCHTANTMSTVNNDPRSFCTSDLRKDKGTFGHIWVIASVFFDSTGHGIIFQANLLHIKIQSDSFWCVDSNLLFTLSGQKHPSRRL